MPRSVCPLCSHLLVEPCGPPNSTLLLLAEYPGFYELKTGMPWSGPGGDVLREELGRVGIQFERCRVTNLWGHAPSKEPGEFEFHVERALAECRGRKAILMMGSDVSRAFLDESVSDVSGLIFTESPLITAGVNIVPCKNPAMLLHRGAVVGDVRHAMSVFGEVVRCLS